MTEAIARQDRGDVAVLLLDSPGRSRNVVDEALLADLRRHVDAVAADDAIAAAVLASGKPGSFGVGADVAWLPQLAARPDADAFLAGVHELMLALVRSPKPYVAALDGPALGGALELALACHEIVATDAATLGLPEVTLGLLPGGGGTQLLRRWVSGDDALDLLLSGRSLGAAEAARRGLVGRLCARTALLDAAVELARALAAGSAARRPAEPAADAAVDLDAARARAAEASQDGRWPAPPRIVDVVATGLRDGVGAGLRAERAAFLELLASPAARAALHLFRARDAAAKRARHDGPPLVRLGVVGGGQMGAGIAATAVSRGISARVRDIDEQSLLRARAYLDRVLARAHPEPTPPQRRLVHRWSATTGWSGFGRVDAVIEAVVESPEVKLDVLATVSDLVPADAVVASNTSAIPIRRLASAVTRPERFLGMHFFSPVERMPLVELIPHEGTAPETVQRAAAIARRLGKAAVTVGDAPGFFTSRVYARWLLEGVRLLLDGARIDDVDAAAAAAGFPVGPLRAHDEATLDLVLAASVTQVADAVFADRLDVATVRDALERLVDAGIRGRRHGRGFYRYEDGRRAGPLDDVYAVLDLKEAAPLPAEAIRERLLLAFVSECLLCWDDGILCHPDDGDVASVLGIGFPRHLGGPFHWVDETGAAAVAERCAALGAAFPGGSTLAALASSGGRFGDLPRRPAPAPVR